jgi:hypothetical protein
MRFRTRFDRSLVIGMTAAAVLTCITLPAMRFLAPGDHPAPPWLVFLPLPVWAAVIVSTLPQYYEVRKDGLFLRQGWRRVFIPYAQLAGIQPSSNSQGAAVFSTERIVILTRDGRRHLIAVAEEDKFIDEVAKHCPQLERRGFGLGSPFSQNTLI